MSKSITNTYFLKVDSLGVANITINSPLNANYTLTLPVDDGLAGQILTTDGVGNTSWTTGATGTVTSVAATVPAFLSITGSPITTNGTLAFTLSGLALPTSSGGTGSTAASTGTGGVVLSTNPTLTTPTLGVAAATTITFPATLTAAKISLYGPAANNFQYSGFGISAGVVEHSGNDSSVSHVYFAGTSATTRTELFRVKGTGGFTSNGNSSVTGDLTVTGNALGGNIGTSTGISMDGGLQTLTTSVLTAVTFSTGTVYSSSGTPGITYSAGTYTNNSIPKTVLVTFQAVFATNTTGDRQAQILVNGTANSTSGIKSATNGPTTVTITAIVRLAAANTITFQALQDSGGNLNLIGSGLVSSSTRSVVTVLGF